MRISSVAGMVSSNRAKSSFVLVLMRRIVRRGTQSVIRTCRTVQFVLFVLLIRLGFEPGVLEPPLNCLVTEIGRGLSFFLVRPAVAVVPASVVEFVPAFFGPAAGEREAVLGDPGVELRCRRCYGGPALICRRGQLSELRTPHEVLPGLVGLYPDALCWAEWSSVDGPALAIRLPKQRQRAAVGGQQRQVQQPLVHALID